MQHENFKIYTNHSRLPDEARFKVGNSWVCFNTHGDVWVVEYGICKKTGFKSVPDAISWVNTFGDRD